MRLLHAIILILISGLFCFPVYSQPSDPDPAPKLRIGVRTDARPFSYRYRDSPARIDNYSAKSGPLRAYGYDGYMVHICDEVFKQMLVGELEPRLSFDQIVPVVVDERLTELAAKASQTGGTAPPIDDRLELLESEVDILCDPATITRDRVRRFAVSPPLFATGVSYLTLRDTLSRNPCGSRNTALIGVVGSTTALRGGLESILAAGELGQYRDAIIAALRGNAKSGCGVTAGKEPSGVIWAGTDHAQVSSAFCNGSITYYVGDLEIIQENARRHAGCDFETAVQTYTDDRYGIFAKIDYSKPEKALLIGRFYEILNREIASSDSLLDRAYVATFGSAPRSQRLEFFYWSMRGTP